MTDTTSTPTSGTADPVTSPGPAIPGPAVPGPAIPGPAVPREVRSARARIPLTEPRGLFDRLVAGYAKRRFGQVPDNLLAMAHNRRVLVTDARFEMSVARWKALDPQLKALAEMSAAAAIECSWCIDFGYHEAHSKRLDTVKIAAVPRWRTAAVFTPVERRVLEYAEAMTATPPTVTDQLVQALRQDIGDAALVELTMMVAVENLRSRFNAALGLASQGFSESCRVPQAPTQPGPSGQQREPS